MNRRHLFPMLATCAAAAATSSAAEANPLTALLTTSAKEKKGVTVYMKGQQIAMIVTSVGPEFVEGRSQAHSRIVVRISGIDAAAMA